ncbi:MAG: hypothetical protein PSV16_06560 [Flavobacterium sp.]|nr:hypothetical protein [Flavobacterium sp.]
MKLTITSLLLFFAVAFSQAQEFKTPLDYLNYISKETDNISKATWKYTSAVAHSKSARKIDATRKSLLKNYDNAQKKIEALKDGYKGDVEYRDQMLSYLTISKQMINEEYGKIIDLQEVAEQSYDYMEAYIMMRDLVNEKISNEVDKINAAQHTFGNKYNIQISEDTSELGKKMKISDEVFENRTQLYLIFFKVNFTEEKMMQAVESKDLNAIQQNANALAQYVDEGYVKLKAFKAYKNDLMLVNVTKKYLDFCKKEAAEFSPGVVSFLMLNQKFEESKTAMDNKSESDRTKAEIDNFNKLVKDVNKEIGNYNNLNIKFNNDRKFAIENWNYTADNFVSKYVPE